LISYVEKKQRLLEALAELEPGAIGLRKRTSNLFRNRDAGRRPQLNLGQFNQVIAVDPASRRIEAEGMTTYADLADAALAHNLMPAVVPQLKSITLGGATAGVGIESSSFRQGLVHHTLLDMEILTGDRRILHCAPDNEQRDLFYGFPNSYGTFGYALKLAARAVPVQPYVQLRHIRHRDPARYFEEIVRLCELDIDFLDGAVFAAGDLYITTGRFTDQAPYASDYTFERIYYKSIREREEDYLRTRDYLWRWDTDWFWCSKNVYAQNPIIRRLYGRRRLNSVTYARIMRFNSRWGITRMIDRLRGLHSESVIQDIDIPIDRAPEFLDFLLREIGILPIWICPIGTRVQHAGFPLYPLKSGALYINFGFWDVIRSRTTLRHGQFNRLVERKTAELRGVKSLYSDSYYPEDEFWQLYDGGEYHRLKRKYDPQGNFPDLYQKCVLRW
jgi:FAD/FMN-containing dehydrogenase